MRFANPLAKPQNKYIYLMQNVLPAHNDLPVNALAAVFNHRASSYKFYWFLGLLECSKKHQEGVFDMEDVVIEMLSLAWHPSVVYKLSFGKTDKLNESIASIQSLIPEVERMTRAEIVEVLQHKRKEPELRKLLIHFCQLVPYRILTPWFEMELRNMNLKDSEKNKVIKEMAERSFETVAPTLYRFEQKYIRLDPRWRHYIMKHRGILEGFALWNLVQYLQKNNPNVPAIADKLFPPEKRNLNPAINFWKDFLSYKPDFRCIYTGEELIHETPSIDHFIPWSFVTHDQLWNLVPTLKKVNSSKGNCLPNERFQQPFSRAQYEAFHFATERNTHKKIMEDYALLFKGSIAAIQELNFESFSDVLLNNIRPQLQIAENMGFTKGWGA